jgi:hypothetical protein
MSRIATPRRAAPQRSADLNEITSIPGPNDLNVPPSDLLEYTICLYGTKGIGKTTLASSIPNSIVAMFEPLRKNLPIRQLPFRCYDVTQIRDEGKPDAWLQFKSFIDKCENDNTVQCIIGDTVDRIYDACLTHHCVIEGVRHPGGLNDFGKLWAVIKDDFEKTLNSIRDMGKGLILISHTKESDIEVVTGGKAVQYGPSCSGAALKYLKAACDYAFFYGYTASQERCLHLRGYENIWTACGVPNHFISPSGKSLELVEIPEGEIKGWTLLQKAFNNELYDHGEEQPTVEKKTTRKRS